MIKRMKSEPGDMIIATKQIVFILIFILLIVPGIISGETISLKLSDLEIRSLRHSPQLKLALEEKKLEEVSAYLAAGLTPANPEFGFKNESLSEGGSTDREQEFELSKSFRMPWIHSLRRKEWNLTKESLGLSVMEYRNRKLAELKSGYVDLALKRTALKEYKRAEKILRELLETMKRKEAAGFTSALNLRMIRLEMDIIRIRIMDIERRLNHKEKEWKQAAGIPPEKEVVFATPIRYNPLGDLSLENVLNQYRSSPGYRKWKYSEKAFTQKIRAERLGFFPEITLGAGFKKILNGPEGPTFGISFRIPLLNKNSIMLKKIRIEKEIHNSRKNWEINSETREIAIRFRTLARYEDFLKKTDTPPVSPSREIRPLLASFREGILDVNGLIGGIQLFLEGMEKYHSVLRTYYSNIFIIESKTGKQMVPVN